MRQRKPLPPKLDLNITAEGTTRRMSAPNSSFDPVEVTALHPDELARAQQAALDAIAAAQSLDELKQRPHRPRGGPIAAGTGQSGDRSASAAGEG